MFLELLNGHENIDTSLQEYNTLLDVKITKKFQEFQTFNAWLYVDTPAKTKTLKFVNLQFLGFQENFLSNHIGCHIFQCIFRLKNSHALNCVATKTKHKVYAMNVKGTGLQCQKIYIKITQIRLVYRYILVQVMLIPGICNN